MSVEEIQLTALHQEHEYLGAKFCSYNGFEAVESYGDKLSLEELSSAKLLVCDLSCLPLISVVGEGSQAFIKALLRKPVYKFLPDEKEASLYPAYVLTEHEEVVDLVLAASLSAEEQLLLCGLSNVEELFEGLQAQTSDLPLQIGNETGVMACLGLIAANNELSWLEEEYQSVVPSQAFQIQMSSFDNLKVVVYRVALNSEYSLYLIQIPTQQSVQLWRSFLSFEKFIPCGVEEFKQRIQDFYPQLKLLDEAKYYSLEQFERPQD